MITATARQRRAPVKPGRMLQSERDKIGPMFAEYMRSIGARETDIVLCQFEVETIYGRLGCSGCGNMIHCRFEDTKRCEPITGQTFSGKWNHYDFDVPEFNFTGKGRPTARDLLDYFKRQLEPIRNVTTDPALIDTAFAVAGRYDSGGFEDASEADRVVLSELLRVVRRLTA